MRPAKWLVLPAYLLAALMIVIPLADVITALMPLRFGEFAWRYGAVGLLSRTFILPYMGVLLAFATAALLSHRAIHKALLVLAPLSAVFLLGLLGIFALDAVQLRTQVRPEVRRGFDIATALAATKHLLFLLASGVFSVSAWKAVRQGSARESKGSAPLFNVAAQRVEGVRTPETDVRPT